MITEPEILDIGFTKLDYSTDDIQYYMIDISRVERYKQYDAHNEYLLTVENTAANKHKLQAYLALAQSFKAYTNGYDTNFKNIGELQAVLEKMIIWDLTH